MASSFGPFKMSVGRMFFVLVIVTCLFIARYVVFQALDSKTRIVSDDPRIWRLLSQRHSLGANASSEYSELWRNSTLGRNQNLNKKFHTTNTSGTFQAIDNSKIWIYSTFFEVTETSDYYIKGLGIAHRERVYPRVYCQVNGSLFEGRIESFLDSHPKYTSYTSIYFRCRLCQGCRPDFVSLTLYSNNTKESTNAFTVHYPQPRKYNITVCHPALHGPYSEPYRIIQSIELNTVLGAQHVFIYNNNVSKETDIVLREYEKDGVLTVLPWPLPRESNAWYYAQHTAINDCVYRNRNSSAYVAIVDVDEFIMPVNTTSWPDMIEHINNEYYGDTGNNKPVMGSMAFESCLFQTKLPNNTWKEIMQNYSFTEEEEEIINRYSLSPLLSFERTDPPFSFPQRSKSIVRPELVFSAGIHSTHRHHESAIQYKVGNRVAIVNHYSMSHKRSKQLILDLNILRLKDLFFPRLKLAINRFAKILV